MQPGAQQPQYIEPAVSHGGQYLRGMSAPGDARMIPSGEGCRGILRHSSYEDRHGVPQHYGAVRGIEDCRGIPQHCSHAGEDCRGIPLHYSHGREDRHGVPQHCSHTIVYDHDSPVL